MINVQCILYVLTTVVYHSHEKSNLRKGLKKHVLINNCTMLLNFDSVVLFSHRHRQTDTHTHTRIYIYIIKNCMYMPKSSTYSDKILHHSATL